jgi:hypothetical protein
LTREMGFQPSGNSLNPHAGAGVVRTKGERE